MRYTVNTDQANVNLDYACASVLTPDDDVQLTTLSPHGVVLYTRTTGVVAFKPHGGGSTITLTAVPAFTRIPVRAGVLNETTTAEVVGLY